MADLNDDIKKYLKGELSPAEMHALEKKALNDPFLEDALAGAAQLDADTFDSDVKDLKASIEQHISQKSSKTISLWVWPARIAAGLILVALSTFVIVKLTGNKTADDLALKRESPALSNNNADEELATDSAVLSKEATKEPNTPNGKPLASTPAQSEEVKRETETDDSKSSAEGGPAITANTEDVSRAEKKSDEELAILTEEVPEEQPAQDVAATEKEQAEAKPKGEGVKITDEERQRRLATATPETSARAPQRVVNFKVIKGRVESEDGVGLPGVNVMIKNTNIGTVTDASGDYQISVAESSPNLVFSFIGFTSEEVAAGDKTQVDVQLNEDVSQLSEIVVMGNIADRKSDDDEKPETLELANPYGGRRAFKQYLEKNIQYPEQALANNIEGRVTIQFSVETSGKLSDFTVIKGIGHGCEEEVIRLVQQGPKWNPTRRNTESLRDRVKVRMKFTLPKK